MRLFDESAPARSRAVARLSLGASPAVLAAMLALQPQVVHAQAFQGTETVILGAVNRVTSGNTDFFVVDALQNTINWVPTDTAAGPAPINFLPAGATASFVGGQGTNGANFTVLNRIIAADPTRAIAFSGTVSSDAAGRIWFYAPGGLLLNAGSQFNVGSLLLTANDPVGAAAGLPYLDVANNFRLQAGAASTAVVDIRTGALINATSNDSYVIAVAPRFNHAGAINVNGSAALVAAQDASFTLNGGLFDITANVGSSAAGNQTVTGSITGPVGDSGNLDYHRIILMAVPRNDAMTLLITGGAQIGFDIAGAAQSDDNAIILSGGYDVSATALGQGTSEFGQAPVVGSIGAAVVNIDGADFTSAVTVRSKDNAQVQSLTGGSSFADNLQVFADVQAIVRGQAGNTVTVAGGLVVDASTQVVGGNGGTNRTAGFAEVSVSGGGSVQAIDVFVTATGIGDDAFSPGLAGGTGQGGTAFVSVAGGSLNTGSLFLDASGFGGSAADGVGGSGIGGTALLQLDPGGTLTLAGDLGISAQAIAELGSAGRQSGNADGRTSLAQFRFNSGTLIVPGTVSVNADARYGEQGDAAHTGGGTATAGRAFLDLFAGANLTTFSVEISAVADGGLSVGNNAFVGGTAQLTVADVGGTTSLDAVGGLIIDASALASNGTANGNVAGGSATGGLAQLAATGSPLLNLGGAEVAVLADATGGVGDGGIGGNAIGGNANLSLDNGGTLSISGDLRVSGAAVGGSGTVGGNATAFDQGDAARPAALVRLRANNGPNTLGINVLGQLVLDGSATAGSGTTGVGGAARGGFAVLRGESGDINAGSVSLLADAVGGFGIGGGAARSGRLSGVFNDANLTTSALTLSVDATGGNATNGGRGGNATVGQAFFVLSSLEAGLGSTVNAGSVTLLAAAQGGAGGGANIGSGGAGGDAFGVDPLATQPQLVIASRPARSTFIATQFAVDNSVVGGEGGGGLGTANGGRGGNAVGGRINIGTTSGPVTPVANRSSFDFGTIFSVDGRATGGNGGGIDGDGLGGRGGDATGGSALLIARGGVVTAGAVSILTSSFGGNGGGGGPADLGGGNALGGQSLILATPHFTAGLPVDVTITGPVTLIATGLGGSSQVLGGSGQGGAANARLQRHEAAGAAPVTTVGSMTIASFSADAGGVGGAAQGDGATGGAGIGGTVDLIAEGGSFDLAGGAQLTAIGRGRDGAIGNTGQAGGAGGAGTGGSATVTVRPGGILTMPLLNADVSARAGFGGDGGTGFGGPPPGIPLPGQRDGNPGGDGQSGGAGGAGGAAVGGNISIGTDAANSGGSITITSWDLRGEALAGVGGGGGVGGTGANGAPGLDGDAVFINGGNGGAGGSGGTGGNAGAGGNATGGKLLIGALSNDLDTQWALNVPLISASLAPSPGQNGVAGIGGTPGIGGAGGAAGIPPGVAGTPGANGFFGGDGLLALPSLVQASILQVLLYNADLVAAGIELNADARGTDGLFGSDGADGRGGTAELVISGGSTSLGYVSLSASGVGGNSPNDFAGAGFGGTVSFRVLNGADVILGQRDAPVQLVARGIGGDAAGGGVGGVGFAGNITTQVNNAGLQVNGDLAMAADGQTGAQSVFSEARGGTLTLRFEDGSSVGVTNRLVMSAFANGSIANGGFVNVVGTGTGILQVDGDIVTDTSVLQRPGLPGVPTVAGDIVFSIDVGNSLIVGGRVTANASATSFSQVPNAAMSGGNITFGNRGTVSVGGALAFDARANFDEGSAGGAAAGGSIRIETLAGTLESNGLVLNASAVGGPATAGPLPTAIGGSIILRNEAGAAHSSRSGNVDLNANATGIFNGNGAGGDAQAGSISVAAGGTLELNMAGSGSFVAEAIGTGGRSFSGDLGGNGFGGDIDLRVGPGGTLNILNPGQLPIELKATGVGGNSQSQGGNGSGGNIVVDSEGNLTTPSLTVNVRGEGGLGLPSGNATAGRADVVVRGGLTSIGGDLVLDGNAVVAGGSVEGDGRGGLLGVEVSAGTLDVAGNLQMLANGDGTVNFGGNVSVNAGSGLLDVGGGITLEASSSNDTFSPGALIQGGQIDVDVGSLGEIRSAQGLTAGVLGAASTPLYGVTAQAGRFNMRSAGVVTLGGIGLDVVAHAGWTQGAQGGSAVGGTANVQLIGGRFETTSLFLRSFAFAGSDSGGTGGSATGGSSAFEILNGTVATVTGTINLESYANAVGDSLVGGTANGGSASIVARAGGQLLGNGFVDNLTADARGGNGTNGNGGRADGGTVLIRAETGGSLALGRVRFASAGATGGNAAGAGNGGVAQSGTLEISADAGTIDIAGIELFTATAVGGNAAGSGNGGNATGANLTLSAATGALVDLAGGAALTLNTSGGSSFGGAGGSSTGARFVTMINAATVDIGGLGLDVIVDSRGGTGVGGGISQGAVFDLLVDSGAFSVAGNTAIRAESAGGFGALGGSGGNASGADIRLQLSGLDNNSRLQLSTAGTVEINTIARAGRGGDGSAGGAGGAATGGSIILGAIGSTGTIALGDVQASVFAEGGAGGDGPTGGRGGLADGGTVFVGMAGTTPGLAGNFTMASADLDASARSGNGGVGLEPGANGNATAGSVGLSVRGANGSVAGNVALVANATSLGAASGGVVELSSEGSSGVAGNFAIVGNVVAETRTTGTPSTAGVVRVFAQDGSRLAMATLDSFANGTLPSASPLRGGLVADTGSTIAIAGDGQIVSQHSLGLNNGGTITAGGRLFVSSGGQVRSAFDIPSDGAIGTIAAQTLEIAGTQGIDLVTNTTGSNDVLLNSSAGSVQLRDLDANQDIVITGTTGISFASLRADRTVNLNAPAGVTGGAVSAGGRIIVTSDAGATLGALDAGTVDPAAGVTPDIYVRAVGPITTGAVTSGGDVGLLAQGALTTGAITSGRDLVLLSGGTITTAALATPTTGRLRLDDFAQRSLITFPNGVPDYSALLVSAPTARAGDTIVTGSVTTGLFEARSIGLLRVTGAINAAIGARLSVRSLEIGSTSTPGFLDLTAVDSLVLADIAVQGQISLNSDGSITTGNITTAQSLVLAANRPGATLTTGNVRADGEIRLSSNTTLTAGSLSSGNRVFLNAGGAITTGAIDAGTVNPQAGASGVLFATSPATIRTGTINVSGSATLSGVLGVTTGNVTASSGIVLLDTGGITTGALSTSTSGFVYIAAHDLLPQITFDQAGNPQFAALLASTPIRLIGDINIGTAGTGRFISAATGSFTAQAITAPTSVLVNVGGAANFNGSIASPNISVTSNNIAIAGGAVIGGDGGQSILLTSDAATTSAVIGGDGTQAAGTYSLSNAEFGALRASSIVVRTGTAPITVQQLALPAIAPGQAANPGVTLQTTGLMRVTGTVTMAQAGAQNRLNLIAGTRIEVVQGSGSVRLGAGVDTPAGTLAITAPRIWVASESLLTELAGTTLIGQARIDAVNAAGASLVAGGSLGAGSILIGADREVLIQNSGTGRLKAGFTTGTGGLRIRRAFEGNGLMDVVINGRIQRADSSFATNSDTLALVQLDPGISLVTAGSTVNGCIITTASCPGLLLDEIFQPVVTIVNNIEELTPEQEEQREAAQQAAEKLPIVLLQRLIDFSPMFVDPDATDPVTSGGNPALWMDPMPRGVRAPGGLN